MEVKSGYKQTEVGVIPNDWICATISEIASPIRNAIVGGPFGSDLKSADYVEEGVPVIRGQNLGSKYVSDPFVFVSQMKAKSLEANLAHPGDLVFTQRGTLGQVSLVPPEPFDSYLVSQSQMKLTVNERKANSDFLYYLFTSSYHQKLFLLNTIQTSLPHINLGILRNIPLQLPPLPEQLAIAAMLSDVDSLIASLDALIAKKRLIKQGVMQELLTGKRRLPGFSGEWEVKRLGEVGTVVMGQSPDSKFYNSQGIGIPLIQGNADIRDRKSIQRVWTTQITKLCNEGDILLTVRAPVGAVGIASHDSCLGRGVCAIKAMNVCRDFLFFFLIFVEEVWKEVEQGSTFTSANSKQVSSFEIRIPKSKEEQFAIAAVLRDMDSEIHALQLRLGKIRLIKQGMMQELLTGRTRIV